MQGRFRLNSACALNSDAVSFLPYDSVTLNEYNTTSMDLPVDLSAEFNFGLGTGKNILRRKSKMRVYRDEIIGYGLYLPLSLDRILHLRRCISGHTPNLL